MYENSFPKKRYEHTLTFLEHYITEDERIRDLGVDNPFSQILRDKGFQVANTTGEDLDLEFGAVQNDDFEVVTALEIFEHLVSPFNVLQQIKKGKLIASVPLKLWFASAYRSKTDQWDRHYHEFEDWQFDWLVEKAGFEIIRRDKWKSGGKWIGFRPVLRNFYNRYYIIEAVRKKA